MTHNPQKPESVDEILGYLVMPVNSDEHERIRKAKQQLYELMLDVIGKDKAIDQIRTALGLEK